MQEWAQAELFFVIAIHEHQATLLTILEFMLRNAGHVAKKPRRPLLVANAEPSRSATPSSPADSASHSAGAASTHSANVLGADMRGDPQRETTSALGSRESRRCIFLDRALQL